MMTKVQKSDVRAPVHVLTGFLGSGKTTLLRHLLSDPGLQDTAVVINEFGEVGLDHLLVREITEDVVLLSSGCLCCALRGDLISTLLDLRQSAHAGEMPDFSRIAIETTGLADPMPIMQAILSEKRLMQFYRLGHVVTTVDAVNGLATLDCYSEATQQIAAADRLVLTKMDLADPARVDKLVARLTQMNPTAHCLSSRVGGFPSAAILFEQEADPAHAGMARVMETVPAHAHKHGHQFHDMVSAFTIVLHQPVDLTSFIDWLEILLASRGDSVLRVKGYLAAIGYDRPLAIQGVQHVVYQPELLREWPALPGRSELVFITRDLTQSAVERSIHSIVAVSKADLPSTVQLPVS